MNDTTFIIVAGDEEAETVEAALASVHQPSCRLADPAEVVEAVAKGLAKALVVAAEKLDGFEIAAFRAAVDRQPAWSDLPILLLVRRDQAAPYADRLDDLGQVRLVERPLDQFILQRAALAAVRSRMRQAGARALFKELERTESARQELSETLEQRVADRTQQLEIAYNRLVRETEERQVAEDRLRETAELYRYTLELSQQIVWTASPDGTHLGRSQRYEELTGLPGDTPPTEAIHPDDVEAMSAAWQAAVASGKSFAADFRLRMRDGTYRTFRARAAARRDEAGRIVRWYGTSEDIEEQQRAEQARHEAEERYRLALRATNDVIWDLNVTTDQIHWSDAAAAIFGGVSGNASTPLGWWEERVHPDDRDRVLTSLRRAIRGRQTHWAESYRFLKADGGHADIFDRGFIIRDDTGKALRAVGAMSDITDRVHAEAQLQRMQAELIHVSRVSAMGTMASTLAHELNQPLTAVSSYVGGSRRLLQDIDDPVVTRVREALESAEAGALRAGRIVRGLRELVARGNVNVKPEELSRLVHDACVLAFVDEHLLGISHRIELDPSAHWVDADGIQIQQVLINLIRNSVQAMADQPVREIVISARAVSRRMVEIAIADTGTGLTAEVREALFSPFRSTKAEGMGIGLSISRTIVEAHHGRIWAQDGADGGTVFRFTLPRAEGVEDPADPLETDVVAGSAV